MINQLKLFIENEIFTKRKNSNFGSLNSNKFHEILSQIN